MTALGLIGKSLFAVKSELMKHTRRPTNGSSSLPPLVGPDEGLVCESVGKADLLSDHFDSKQSS